MRIILVLLTILSLSLTTYAQKTEIIDTAYDPIVIVNPTNPKIIKPKPIIPVQPDDKSKLIVLKNYRPGKFKNEKSVMFCNMVVDEIDNIMKRNDKIISVQIKGYADGLSNPGLDFSSEQVYSECLKYLDISKRKVNDEQLAILRACEIEGQLKNLLSSKSYLIYISFTNSYFDIEDGGLSGKDFRKVEVLITYLNRKM